MRKEFFLMASILILALALATAVIPSFLVFTLLFLGFPKWVGIIHFFVSGILYIIGSYYLFYKLEAHGWTKIVVGSIFGVISWSILIPINAYALFWNQNSIVREDIFLGLGISILQTIEPSIKSLDLVLYSFIIISNRDRFILIFNRALIHLIFVISACILGIIIFVKARPKGRELKFKIQKYYLKLKEFSLKIKELISEGKKDEEYKLHLTKKEAKRLLILQMVFIVFIMCVFVISIHLFQEEIYYSTLFFIIFIVISNSITFIWRFWPKEESPKIIELDNGFKDRIKEELKEFEIYPKAELLTVIENIAYSDPEYARKSFRKYAWREKGIIILTKKELFFIGYSMKFLIPINEINLIQSFVTPGAFKTCKVCEINYGADRSSAIVMGTIGYSTINPMDELERKSMKLMNYLQKWYDSYYAKLRLK